MLVGTNNTSHTAEEVAEGIFEIVKVIREKLPDTYIVLPVGLIATIQFVLDIFTEVFRFVVFRLDASTSWSTAEQIAWEKSEGESIDFGAIFNESKR